MLGLIKNILIRSYASYWYFHKCFYNILGNFLPGVSRYEGKQTSWSLLGQGAKIHNLSLPPQKVLAPNTFMIKLDLLKRDYQVYLNKKIQE